MNLVTPDSETIELVNKSETDVSHDFKIDARALSSPYYYKFQLNNTDDQSVVQSKTSSNFDTGIESYSEVVTNLQTGNYSWSVKVYRASDDLKLESASTTYDIEKNPLFTQDINSPIDSSKIFIDPDQSNVDVNISYQAEAFSSDVVLVAYLDGVQVSQNTTPAGEFKQFSDTIQDVTTGTHTLKLVGTDGDGRTQTTKHSFEVATKDDQSIEFTTIKTIPSLSDASAGQQVDVYVEGEGNVSDVDYLQLEIKVAGEVVETKIIDTDNLKSGSWYITLEDAFTVTKDIIGKAASLVGEARSVAGDIVSYTQSYDSVGSNRDISVSLIDPNDGKVFDSDSYQDANSDSVPFRFEINALDNPIDYDLLIRPNGSNSYSIPYGTSKTGTVQDSKTIELYRNMLDTFSQQYGEFDWKVELREQNTNRNTTSSVRTFSITKPQNATLNFINPNDHDTFYLTGQQSTKNVKFRWDVDTTEKGTVELEVNNFDKKYQANKGLTQFTDSIELDEGSYIANLTFKSDNFEIEKSHEFSINKNEPELESYIKLLRPQDNATLYQASGLARRFGWEIQNSVESGSGEGNSTLYIENDNNNVVKSFSREYDTQNEPQSYTQIVKPSTLNLGVYNWYVKFDSPSQASTQKSSEFKFTVKDFNPPKVTIFQPKNKTYTNKEKPQFEFEVESFEQSPKIQLRVRNKGEYSSTILKTYTQSGNTKKTYSFDNKNFTVGSYEWFVRTQPDQFRTFDSNISTFEVEPSQIKEPEFSLIKPDQGETFSVPNGSDSAKVKFEYASQSYSDNDASVKLMLQNVSEDSSTDYTAINSHLQNDNDGNQTFTFEKDLTEQGYRWKLKLEYPNGQKYESDAKSFAVNDPETEFTPQPPAPSVSPTYLDRATSFLVSLTGQGGTMFLAVVLTLASSVAVTIKAESDKLGMATMVLVALGFTTVGWFPSWIAVVFVLISVGITVFLTNKLLNAGAGGG